MVLVLSIGIGGAKKQGGIGIGPIPIFGIVLGIGIGPKKWYCGSTRKSCLLAKENP